MVVDDGDTKGFQSNAGKAAKRQAKIKSLKLPPRSPGWMPLDFCIWREIEARVLRKEGNDKESFQDYKKRLAITAKRLPAKLVRSCLTKTKANIAATVTSKGRHTTLD